MPAFYVTMPFASPQLTFNYTAYMKGKSPGGNTTIPACKLYNGKAYTSCGHCNITSFMTMNVTYGCYDISKLCPKGAATSRRLDEANAAGVVEVDVGIDAEEWQELEEMEWIENEHEFNARWLRRALRRGGSATSGESGGTTDDAGKTDDTLLAGAANATSTETTDDEGADGGESHDDIFNTQNSVSANEFGALAEVRRSHQSRPTPSHSPKPKTVSTGAPLSITRRSPPLHSPTLQPAQGIADQLVAVLSFNPFSISLSAAVPAIAFVGTLIVVTIMGFVYFLRKDKAERHAMVGWDLRASPHAPRTASAHAASLPPACPCLATACYRAAVSSLPCPTLPYPTLL